MYLKNQLKKIEELMNNNDFFSKLFKNVIISFVGETGAAVITFVTTIFLITIIGNTSYGILSVGITFMLIIDNLVNFQSWHAMITFGSQCIEEERFDDLASIIKVGIILDLFTAVLGWLITFSFADYVCFIMGWNGQTSQVIKILSFIILFNFTGATVGVIRLFDKFRYYSIYRVLTELFKLVISLGLYWVWDLDLLGAAFAYSVSHLLGHLFLLYFFVCTINNEKSISISALISSKIGKHWKSVFSFTFWTSVSSSADIPVQQFDVMFLSMISYEVVAVFKVYKQICQGLNKFSVPLKQSVLPLFSELVSQNKVKECYVYLIDIRNKSIKILLPIVFIITLISSIFMYYTLDYIYIRYWYILFVYLILRAYALSYTSIHPLFIALGEVKNNFYYTLVANFLYVIVVGITLNIMGIWAILLGLFCEYYILIYLKMRKIKHISFR